MTRHLTRLAAAALLACPAVRAAADIGLAARFGDVILEDLEPGRSYNLREAARLPFAIENRGDAETEVSVEFTIPPARDVAKGYEAVPDPSWFKAVPASMVVAPKRLGYFDLILTVPDDPVLKGKHYQVLVKARTNKTGMLGLAIENRIRFSVGPGPQSLAAEKKKKAMQKLDFDVTPGAIYLKDVPVGADYDVKKGQGKAIRVANYSGEELVVALTSEAWDGRFDKPEDYLPVPDPSWIVFRSSHVKVGGESIAQASFSIRIPDKKEFKGRKYAALIKTGLATGFWLDAPVRVYFETKE